MPAPSLKVFLSYAHEDKAMKNQLNKFLVSLIRSGKIKVWQDRECIPGQEWDETIKTELATADIVLLLISADFNASDYIWEKELAISMERHEKGEARVIPIILRSCDYTDMPYSKLQALPTDAKPVTEFSDPDIAYTEIAKGIRRVIDVMTAL